MKKQIRAFEFLLNMSLLLQLLRDLVPDAMKDAPWLEFLEENYVLSYPVFAILFLLMIRHEGTRMTVIFIASGQLFLISCKYFYSGEQSILPPVMALLTVSIVTLSSVIYYFMPMYDLPGLTGMYGVGYRTFLIDEELQQQQQQPQSENNKGVSGQFDQQKINNNNNQFLKTIQVAVYYPTIASSNQRKEQDQMQKELRAHWAPQYFLQVLHDVVKNSPQEVVGRFSRLFMHVLEKVRLDVFYNAQIMQSSSKFPLIIFSHGLGSHYNYHSSILRDLASKGCVVFSIQHFDFVEGSENRQRDSSEFFKKWVQLHRPNFERRLRHIKRVVEHLRDQANVDQIFSFSKISYINKQQMYQQQQQQNPGSSGVVQLDWDRLTLMGHSFGGATALFAALRFSKSQNQQSELTENKNTKQDSDNNQMPQQQKEQEIEFTKKKTEDSQQQLLSSQEQMKSTTQSTSSSSTQMRNPPFSLKCGGLVLLDPAMDPLNDADGRQLVSSVKLDIPILIVNSEYFNTQLAQSKQWENERFLFQQNREAKNVHLNCYLKGTGHENFGDMAYWMPRELNMSRKAGEVGKAGLYTILVNKLIEQFFSHCVLSEKEVNLRDKEQVLKDFGEMCKEKLKLADNPLQTIEPITDKKKD